MLAVMAVMLAVMLAVMQSLRCLIKHRSPAISWSFVYKILNISYDPFLGRICLILSLWLCTLILDLEI